VLIGISYHSEAMAYQGQQRCNHGAGCRMLVPSHPSHAVHVSRFSHPPPDTNIHAQIQQYLSMLSHYHLTGQQNDSFGELVVGIGSSMAAAPSTGAYPPTTGYNSPHASHTVAAAYGNGSNGGMHSSSPSPSPSPPAPSDPYALQTAPSSHLQYQAHHQSPTYHNHHHVVAGDAYGGPSSPTVPSYHQAPPYHQSGGAYQQASYGVPPSTPTPTPAINDPYASVSPSSHTTKIGTLGRPRYLLICSFDCLIDSLRYDAL
jgi:hypothetical protein